MGEGQAAQGAGGQPDLDPSGPNMGPAAGGPVARMDGRGLVADGPDALSPWPPRGRTGPLQAPFSSWVTWPRGAAMARVPRLLRRVRTHDDGLDPMAAPARLEPSRRTFFPAAPAKDGRGSSRRFAAKKPAARVLRCAAALRA